MAYDIVLSGAADQDGPETFALCSVGAWGEFREWARGLPGDDYAALRRLADAGYCEGTDALAKDCSTRGRSTRRSRPGCGPRWSG